MEREQRKTGVLFIVPVILNILLFSFVLFVFITRLILGAAFSEPVEYPSWSTSLGLVMSSYLIYKAVQIKTLILVLLASTIPVLILGKFLWTITWGRTYATWP